MSTKPSSVVCFSAAVLLFATVFAPRSLYGQAVSNATVTGRFTDEQAAVVPNETGAVYSSLTNADGMCAIPNLPIGAYTLQAAVPGFQTYVQTGIARRVGGNVQINIGMKVGGVSERVEVAAAAGMV